MLRLLFYTIIIAITSFQLNAQNCPGYSNTAMGPGQACGDQTYTMNVENTTCNGQVYFNITGSLGFLGTFEVVSSQSNVVVASGSGGFWGSTVNQTIGPLDPNVHGTIFDLIVDGGNITITQNGNTIANSSGGHILFFLNINISPATITVTTPSGPVTSVVNNCNDFNLQIPLSNTNFCNSINVTLPWTITCNVSGAIISSGSHTLTVNPQVPSDASDLVDITWNTTTCSWEVSPQNDCDLLDVGNIFTISPDPATLTTDACGSGNESFVIDYLGITGSPDCCATAGPQVNIIYDEVLTTSDAIAINSPFGGINNSALIGIPPNNIGGNATSLDLCVNITGFCFDPPGSSTDNSFYLIIFIDGNQVYMSPPQLGTSHNICIDLLSVTSGYTQSSNVEIYVLPNLFSSGTINTNYAPNKTCGTLADGQWVANIDATFDVVFDQMVGSPVSCSFTLTSPHSCCDPTPPTASSPAPINTDCNTNIPAPNPLVITDEASMCNTPPTVTFVSDVSDGNVCQGEQVTRTYHVEDACGNGIDVTQLINITATNPVFTLTGTNPLTCGGADGEITVGGLNPNTVYSITYSQNGTVNGPISVTTNASGEYNISGLPSGNYTDFIIGLSSCSACESTNTPGVTLNDGAAAVIDAGADQSVCLGSTVILTAINPNGATISWDNGVTDGVAFTPPLGTTTYIVTADLAGCTSSDMVVVTVHPLPTPTINVIADQCESETSVVLSGNPSGGTFSGIGVTGNNFNPSVAGIGNHTITYNYTDGNGCSNSTTTAVVVVSNPIFTLSSVNPSACLASDGSITIAGLQPNSTYTVSYEDAAGTTVGPTSLSSNAAGNILINNLGSGSYLNFIVEINGCIGTNSTTVNLVAPGAPNISAGLDIQVCEGESVTLTAVNPDGATISWNNGVTDGIAFAPSIGATSYIVTGDLGGCTSTDVVVVTVIANPVVDAGNDITVCEGDQVTLNASGAATYSWNNGVVNGQPFTPPFGTTVYEVTGVNTAACEGKDNVNVTVVASPDVSFIVDKDRGCLPLTVNFTNTSTGIGTCTYTLSNGVELNSCNPTYTFTQPGCFNVTLSIENNQGCSSSVTQTNMICIDSPPIANFTANPAVIGGLTDEVNFNNSSVGANSYEWIFGDGAFSNDIHPTHQYKLEKDEYRVILIATSSMGCSDTTSTVIPVEEELIYYVPNSFTPDGDNLNQTFKPIFTSGFDPLDYHFVIFNRWGETVFESHNANFGWDGTYGIDQQLIAKEGTYVYTIEFKRNNNDKRMKISGHVNLLK
ncbi:MAG TPA: PKD domain-containing protein [Brumimicrobium sp.]|nr:PKD domain-containing protein [Brumimicrobium sp.]